MKFFILIASFVGLIAYVKADYPKETNEEHNKIIAECRQTFKMTDEEYTKLRRNELTTEPNENMKCLANCVMEKSGILKDGVLQQEEAKKLVSEKNDEEKSKSIVEKCGSESGKDKCETAFKLHQCFVKHKGY